MPRFEGFPARCPICGGIARVQAWEPLGEVPCRACELLLAWFERRFGEVTADTPLLGRGSPLKLDSLDLIELFMDLEDGFGISIPDAEYEQTRSIRTVGDAIRLMRRIVDDAPRSRE